MGRALRGQGARKRKQVKDRRGGPRVQGLREGPEVKRQAKGSGVKCQKSGMRASLRKTQSGAEEMKGSERLSLARVVHEQMWGRKVLSPGVGGWWPAPQLVNLHLHSLHLCQELLLRGAFGSCQVGVCPTERSRPGRFHHQGPGSPTPPLRTTPLGPFLLCSAAARPEASSYWQSPHSGSSVGDRGAVRGQSLRKTYSGCLREPQGRMR